MGNILFLCQRIPFPPDKGDKIRSYRALMHLAENHDIHLGTFLDDPDDERHVSHVEGLCSEARIIRLSPLKARLKSLLAFFSGEPLSKKYFASNDLNNWVQDAFEKTRFDGVYIFSSVMAQYVMNQGEIPCPVVIDYVDVDSEKFRQYARERGFISRIVYGREGRKLLAFDRKAGALAKACLFVSDAEAGLFRELAPELAKKPMGFQTASTRVTSIPERFLLQSQRLSN